MSVTPWVKAQPGCHGQNRELLAIPAHVLTQASSACIETTWLRRQLGYHRHLSTAPSQPSSAWIEETWSRSQPGGAAFGKALGAPGSGHFPEKLQAGSLNASQAGDHSYTFLPWTSTILTRSRLINSLPYSRNFLLIFNLMRAKNSASPGYAPRSMQRLQ